MENNNNSKKLGDDYRDCIKTMLLRNFMFPMDLVPYMRDSELQVFMFVCNSINTNDKCTESYDYIAEYLGISGVSVRRALSKLKNMGFIRDSHGFHSIIRDIDYYNFTNFCNLLSRNPGISWFLRNVMGERNISEITNKEILMANKLYNEAHGIKNKTRQVAPVSQIIKREELSAESVPLFSWLD